MPRTPRIRAVLARAGLVAISLVVVLALLEVVLRMRPTLLGADFANGAFSRYSTRAGGIYYRDPNLRMNFMLPNHSAMMYANKYVWHHRTDALGFRNDVLQVPADAMFLGDSLVYGHGAEAADTLAAQFQHRTGFTAVNLGRQGDCAFQEAYLLAAFLPVYRARYVFHVFTPNDILDAYTYLSDEAMEAFIATPVDRITYPPRQDVATALRQRQERQRWWRTLQEQMFVAKMFRWLNYRREQRRLAFVTPAWAARGPRRYDSADPSIDPRSLGWRYTEHALAYMKHVADRAGARFYTVPVAADRQEAILAAIATRHGIPLIETQGARNGEWMLPEDWHFSPLGARQMADVIARYLEREAVTQFAAREAARGTAPGAHGTMR